MRVNELARRVGELLCRLDRARDIVEGLRKEKTDLKEMLLRRLEELKQALDDISPLEERVPSDRSEIAALRDQIDQVRAEKLDLRHKVRILEKNLEHCEREIDEIRADKSRQSA